MREYFHTYMDKRVFAGRASMRNVHLPEIIRPESFGIDSLRQRMMGFCPNGSCLAACLVKLD